jgi:hypothetical protein
MHRTVIGVCFAGAIGLAATLGAQSPTTTASQSAKSDHEVTISGCLSKGATGYMLNNAHVEPNASASTTTTPGSTTTTASSPTPTTTTGGATTTAGTTGTTGSAAAAAAAAGAASPAMTWMLSGDSDLEKHVGHKIQVTGKTTWSGSPSATTGTASTTATTTSGASAEQPRLDVKSIKMVSASCS